MSSRRRRRNPVHELLARLGRRDLATLPVEVADAPRLRLPLPRLTDCGLPGDGEWRAECRLAIAPKPSDSK